MKLDESLFEDYLVEEEEDFDSYFEQTDAEEYSDSEEAEEQGAILSDLENKIATLEVGDKELQLSFNTPIAGLTDVGYTTLHISRRTPDWYRVWLTNDEGQIANDNQFSSFDNTLYWAQMASQGQESGEEVTQETEVEVVEESLDNDGVALVPPKPNYKVLVQYNNGNTEWVDVLAKNEDEAKKFAEHVLFNNEYPKAIEIRDVTGVEYTGDESLKEDLELTTTGEEISEPEEKQINNDYRNQLIEMINGEWETIQDYNDLVNMLANIEEYKEYIPVIEGIIEDEHHHIGNLQNVLDKLNPDSNKDIEHGDEEAQEILDKEGE